ncbi:YfbK domain-containing protein [Streptomyces sp. NPDC002851]
MGGRDRFEGFGDRRRRLRGLRGLRRLVALAAAGGILLTGCSGSGNQATGAVDKGRSGGGAEGAMPAPGQGGAAEGDKRQENGKDVAPDPDHLSTFALDVDTASYGYARRTLGEGRMPAPSTVRPEEFINSFQQEYAQPEGNGLAVSTDGARAPGESAADGDWSLLRVGLASKAAPDASQRPPAALTFVIDVSGSMSEPGRLDLVRDSLRVMTNQLRPEDSVAIVTFSSEAETVLPMTRLGGHAAEGGEGGAGEGAGEDAARSGNRGRVHAAIDELRPTDSTNLDAGIRTGYDTAVEGHRPGATNRVVLLSDALANTGETSADAILEQISTARREHGITLFGVGVGSEYGDALMERLADKGDGHTTYVSTEEEARKVFVDDLPTHIELRARDAKAQVAFDPETVESFRLIGYDNRRVADEDFRDDLVDGGEVGPGHTVTALYAVRLKESASGESDGGGGGGRVATATVRWLDPKTRAPHESSSTVDAADLRGSLWGSADRGLQVAASAAYFADALRSAGRPDTGTYRPSPCGAGASHCSDGAEPADSGFNPKGTGTGDGDGDRFIRIPGTMSLAELQGQVDRLARDTGEADIRQLATAVGQAADLT